MQYQDRKGSNIHKRKLKVVDSSDESLKNIVMEVEFQQLDEGVTNVGTPINAKLFNELNSKAEFAKQTADELITQCNTASNLSQEAKATADSAKVLAIEAKTSTVGLNDRIDLFDELKETVEAEFADILETKANAVTALEENRALFVDINAKAGSAINKADDASKIADDANKKADETRAYCNYAVNKVDQLNGETVKLYDEQNIRGKKIFAELYATDKTLAKFVFLGDNLENVKISEQNIFATRGDRYYFTAYYKDKLQNESIYLPALIIYNDALSKIEMIHNILPDGCKSAIITSIEIDDENRIFLGLIEGDFEYGSKDKYCIYEVKGASSMQRYPQTTTVIEMKTGYTFATSGEGPDMIITYVPDGKLYFTDTMKIYSFNKQNAETVTEFSLPLQSGASIVKYIVDTGSIWMLTKAYASSAKIYRYLKDAKTINTINFPDGVYIEDWTDKLNFGYIHFFTHDNRLFNISKLTPITPGEIPYRRELNQTKFIAQFTRENEIFSLTQNIHDPSADTYLCHYNMLDSEIAQIGIVKGLSFENNLTMHVNDSGKVVIADDIDIYTYKNAICVQEYMEKLDAKMKEINALIGNNVESNERYLELKDELAKTLKPGSNISNMVNDANYQTFTQVTDIVNTSLSGFSPSGGGSGNIVLWQGRIREDELFDVTLSGIDYYKTITSTWGIENLLNLPDFGNNDKIRIHLETDLINTSNYTNYVDVVTIDYKLNDREIFKAKDYMPMLEEDYDIKTFIFAPEFFNWYYIVNGNSSDSVTLKPEYGQTFGRFAELYLQFNHLRGYADMIANGIMTEQEAQEMPIVKSNKRLQLTHIAHASQNEEHKSYFYTLDSQQNIKSAMNRFYLSGDLCGSLTAGLSEPLRFLDTFLLYYITKVEVIKC